jgi:PAS domain S-box-containing protein
MEQDRSPTDNTKPPSLWDAIASREAQLLALVEGSVQIVWATDANGGVLADPPPSFAHLTWSRFTGLEQTSIRGFGWRQAVHPDDLPTVQAMVTQAIATKHPVRCELRVRHHSGEWRWMIVRGNAIRASDGTIAGWMGSCTDITSSKQIEAALHESQERLVAALEAGEMGTWIWRFEDNSFWWDAASVKLWGREGNEETEHNVMALLHHIHDDDRAHVEQAMASFAHTGSPSMIEFRTKRSDNALQWLASRGRIERDANGNATHAVGAFMDITKIKAVQESLRVAQKMQSLGTLAGGIAHDFNNLLLAMSGNAKLAMTDLGPEHPASHAIGEIIKAGQRAADLVRRILSFAAQRKTAASYTNVDTALNEALEFSRATLPANVTLTTDFAADTAQIEVPLDAVELQQVILNLVGNAIQAIGERRGTITVTANGSSDTARITVADTGCGMEPSTVERIFDPFFSTKPSGQGTGLGLSVVHGIVTSVGGTVTVDSTVGTGSRFTVTLPARPHTANTSANTDVATPQGGGQHILYVDDDEALVMLMTRMLERLGYRVTGFTDPAAAVRAFGESPQFDAVVTDLSMPQMSGFDLAAAIKAVRSDVPVVMTSGYVQAPDEERAQQIGVKKIILKPNTVEELAQSLAQLFGR